MSQEALKLLKEIEWSADFGRKCPICGWKKPKHYADCELAHAISLLESQPEPGDLKYLLLCRCGWVGTVDEQEALGTECGCCPDCANEDLIFVKEACDLIDRLTEEIKALRKYVAAAEKAISHERG